MLTEELTRKLDNIASKYGLIKVKYKDGIPHGFALKWVSVYTSIEFNQDVDEDPLQIEIIDIPELIYGTDISKLDDIVVDISNSKDALEEMIKALENENI